MNDVVKPPRVVLPHKAECVQIYPDTGKVADIPAENGAQQSQGEFLRVSTSSSGGVGNVAGVVAVSPLGDFRPSLLASLVSGATYGRAGNTVTVTATAHGLPTNRDGYRIFWPGSAAIAPGWYDGFAYVDANTFTFQSAASQTVPSGTAITGALPYVTSTTLASASAPGKLLGKNGRVSAMITASGDATAGQKDTRLAINGSGISAAFHLATCNSTYSLTVVNANSYNKQVGVSSQDGTGTNTASTVATQDTSVEFTVSVTAKLQNASQWRAYDHIEIQVVTLP